MNWMNCTHLSIVVATAGVLLQCAAPQAAGQAIRNERIKVVADDGAKGDAFGVRVAISGTTAIVGAVTDDHGGTDSGSAYLVDVTNGVEFAKLLAQDGADIDHFGGSVAICGTTALVGAARDDDNGLDSGSVYLFDVTTGRQIAKLLPDDGEEGDWFGISVAISGSVGIVGARYDDNDNRINCGSAYLFDTTTFAQTAQLLADDGAPIDLFGASVAIDGSTCVVGAVLDETRFGRSAGSAYLFDVATGMQIAHLLPIDGAENDKFGESVAISGTICIVGAASDDTRYGRNSGSAYLFDVTTGRLINKLLPNDGTKGGEFGTSVAINGSTCIVGAPNDDDNGAGSGSAYLFDVATGRQIAKLLPRDGAPEDEFGISVAINGSTSMVGAWYDDDNGRESGSAYLFGTRNLILDFSGACPGTGAFTVTNATPGGPVAIVHGFGDGPVTVPNFNPCPGTLLNVGSPRLGSRIVSTDANGVALLNTNLPPAACNQLRVQALDLGTCETSEVVLP